MCRETAETFARWRDRFAKKGVAFVAVDNEHAIVDRFSNEFVPAFYVFNRAHQLRHFQAGGKGFDRIEAAIQRVLDEPALEPA